MSTPVLVVAPFLHANRHQARSIDGRLEEAVGLADAIHLDVKETFIAPIAKPNPATLLGKGKVEEISQAVERCEAELVFVDGALSPVQQRNLETAFKAKVIDRTGLILEIFGERAHTREGVLQVELAHLTFQKSRLVRSWTHLERQRGGFGFLGGPGETQIETDRRLIQERITKLKKELAQVTRTRHLQRENRERVPYPSIALVGYTNAGKSTLFNRLTKAEVSTADQLFETLDPTLRRIKLPAGSDIILSDTVGFIADLPTQLIAAFRATLEEVISAEIILHVRDITHPESDLQAAEVYKTLKELGVSHENGAPILEVWNKADRLTQDQREALQQRIERMSEAEKPVLLSALTGDASEILLKRIEEKLAASKEVLKIQLPVSDGEGITWLYRNGEVLNNITHDETMSLEVRLAPKQAAQARKKFKALA